MEQQGEKVQRLELLKKVSLARLAARHKRDCNSPVAEGCGGKPVLGW